VIEDHEYAGLSITRVHQVLPSLHVADASGAHTLHVRDALRSAGFQSELFVDHVDAALAGVVHNFEELDSFVLPGQTAILYQLAVGSRLVDHLLMRTEPLLVNYHNLTPASFYWKWAPDWLEAVALGRSQLYALAKRTSHAIAVSEFNEGDLRGAGYRSASVVPPFVGAARTAPQPRSQATHKDPQAGATWLFVGKLLPHKAAQHLVRALAVYREMYDPQARLVLIGGHPIASFADAVREYSRSLGIADAVEMAGATSDSELADAYERADAFVCLSDHEGFCFPLLEAMAHGIPVVAFAAGAVPDTLGDAGILLHDKSGATVAAAVHRVVTDAELRSRLVEAGAARLRKFDLVVTERAFTEEIRSALGRIERQREEVAVQSRARLEIAATAAYTTPGINSSGGEPDEATGVAERWFDAPPSVSEISRMANRVANKPEPVRAIHQLVPMLVPGDATSDHAIQLRKLAHDMGLDSEIFATAIHDDLHAEGMLIHELPDRTLPGTLFVYQMSSGSPMVELARDRKEPLAVNFHNLTPAWTYDRWEPGIAGDQRWAARQVGQLAQRASIGIGDSAFNASELLANGYREAVVCPVLVDLERLGPKRPNPAEQAREKGSTRNWLFVGRIAPHKGQHRLVQALAAYVRLYGDDAHLDLVGTPGSFRYADAVRRLAEELGVGGLVTMVGGVDDSTLGEYYRNADVFVSASVHEGFGVPLVEAMHHGVPVVAFEAGAVADTLQGAGLLLTGPDPGILAAAVHNVVVDGTLRERLVGVGTARAGELTLEHSRATMRRVLQKWIDENSVVEGAEDNGRLKNRLSAIAGGRA